MALARISVVVLALVCCAWFILGIRQTRDTNAASAIASKPPHIAVTQGARAAGLLRSAKVLNPDRGVNILQARFALLGLQHAHALIFLMGLVAREPMNVAAWAYLTEAALPSDPAAVRLALKMISELDPKSR